MQTAKTTKVLLEAPKSGLQQEFAVDHAENLLRMKDHGSWQLPKDSKFEMTEDGLKYRTNKEGAKGKPKGTSSLKGESASEQD